MSNGKNYYLGLDIGTDSVGYAVTDEEYKPLKFKGEPMMGVHLFDASVSAEERRNFRTARRRLNRKQQRVVLLQELFAEEIAKIDKDFFIRIKKSSLSRDEDACTGEDHIYFNSDLYSDKDYYREYPTIHHLIYNLMTDTKKHDVRLVYIACAWLMAHRGHFLNEVDKDNIEGVLDFRPLYENLKIYAEDRELELWDFSDPDAFAEILQKKTGISIKQKEFYALLFNGKAPKNQKIKSTIALLSGGKAGLDKVFGNDEYKEISKSFSLGIPDEEFDAVLPLLGDDADYIIKLKALYDWSVLKGITGDFASVSEAKIQVYEQHKKDLKNLKYLIKKYKPEKYDDIFKKMSKDANYVAYSGNLKSYNVAEDGSAEIKFCKKDGFCDYIKKQVKDIKCDDIDIPLYEDMTARLDNRSFLPKQTDGDNRVIPYQLYYYELKKILENASGYLSFINNKDNDGISTAEKILSVFTFRIPYFVGPLNTYKSKYAWIVRKAEGKIYPWNFSEKVDIEQCEQEFIRRMTAKCTYIPGEDVIPKNSLLYTAFNVLNEINNLRINNVKIPVEIKQEIYNNLFLKYIRVTPKKISDYLLSRGIITKEDVVDGIDISVKSNLKPWHDFRNLLSTGILSTSDAEKIIERATCIENTRRFTDWLRKEYPELKDNDIKYLKHLNYKDFGRLSVRLLKDIPVTDLRTGETASVIEWLWNSENNFMQLLSEKFSLRDSIEKISREYYNDNPMTLPEKLDSMYVSPSVKRPVIRTLDVISDVTKAMGCAPKKIFVEMARGAKPEQKNKRKESRKNNLIALYKNINTEEARLMNKELDELGEKADNILQSDRVYLYFMQLGRCLYSGRKIDNINLLRDKTFDIEHIYPRCFVKDDSIINNEILVDSKLNAAKSDTYPVPEIIRNNMLSFWTMLKNNKLMSEEKYRRLTRNTPFTQEERWQFINRQLVETQQSTKVIASLLKEKFPEADIVYVKAGLVSEFRHDVLKLSKSRSINDLHHAKDAYLNIVAGNVYNVKFTKNWFSKNWDKGYSIKATTLFGRSLPEAHWKGGESIDFVRKIMGKNAIHYVRYSYCRKGGLFDQMPVKAKSGLVPLKKGMPTEKYGGYNKASASFFVLTEYRNAKKHDVIFMPVELLIAGRFLNDKAFAVSYAAEQIKKITNQIAEEVSFPLGDRVIKINTVLSLDGIKYCITGKASNGTKVLISNATSNILNPIWEKYIKSIEKLLEKREKNPAFIYDEKYDVVNKKLNSELYDLLTEKAKTKPFLYMRANPVDTLNKGKEKFEALDIINQSLCLMQMLSLYKTGRASGCDLTYIGGVKQAAVSAISSSLSNIVKDFKKIRIVDYSASGLFESRSINLAGLL